MTTLYAASLSALLFFAGYFALIYCWLHRDSTRRCVPSSRVAQAGAPPKAFYCNASACPNYAPSGSAKALTHRPSHACRHTRDEGRRVRDESERIDSSFRPHPSSLR